MTTSTLDADGRCSQSDLPPEMCAHCRGHDDQAVVDVEPLTRTDVIGFTFSAGYRSTCGHCGGEIGVGAQIQRLRDGSGYACPDCQP